MQYYFGDEDNLYDDVRGKPFAVPAKTKQMGSIEPYVKIYLEDYVYTYLYQYGRSGGGAEKLAALVGRHNVIEGQEVVVISGAIQAKATAQSNGVECFTEETWEYIGGQMQKYFKGMQIIGWVHCQPGFGSFLMSRDESFHMEYFKEPWQVLFVMDSMDKLDTFYIYPPERKHLQPARGYFIYYDKNQEMQEYMLENSCVRSKENIEEGLKTVEPSSGKRTTKPTQEERLDAAKEIRRVLQRREITVKQTRKEHYTSLFAVSVMLCAVCVCMALAMLHNFQRLQMLETELVAMQTSYATLAEGFEDVKVQSVFALQQAEQAEQMAAAVQEPEKTEVSQAEEPTQPEEITEPEEAKAQTYCVVSGDNLGFISDKFYGTSRRVEEIMEANGLENADMIFEGQILLIP